MPRHLPGFVPSHSGETAPLMPISSSAKFKSFTPERVQLTVNSRKETNGRVKMAKSQDGLLLFTPERVELTVNSKKETNGRVKMDQESR